MSSNVTMFPAKSVAQSMNRSAALCQNNSAALYMKLYAADRTKCSLGAPVLQEEVIAQEDPAVQAGTVPRKRRHQVMGNDLQAINLVDLAEHMEIRGVVGALVNGLGVDLQVQAVAEEEAMEALQALEAAILAAAPAVDHLEVQVVGAVMVDHLQEAAKVVAKAYQDSSALQFRRSSARVCQSNSAEL